MLILRTWFEDPNQHLKDFLKLVDSLDLDVANRERTRLRLFQFSLRDQASNWLERLPAGSISTWEDLTTHFLAQFFPPGRTAKLHKYVESLELGKYRSAFIQSEMPKKMEDPRLFTLPYGTKSYPIRIVRDVEVHIGRLKLLTDFYAIDMKKDPETPLLVGEDFLATTNAFIDYRKAKIVVGEGITRLVFRVKGIKLGQEEAPYWTTLGKMGSYKPRPSSDGVGSRTPYYARNDFLDCFISTRENGEIAELPRLSL
ncbi:zinc finger, CCHC-type containing protein [Tanacetum coccineum]